MVIGLKGKVKILKAEGELGGELGNQLSFNLRSGLAKNSILAKGNIGGALKFGKTEIGLKFGRQSVTVSEGVAVHNLITENRTVLGFKQGQLGIQNPGIIGGELTFLLINVGFDIDIKQFIEGLLEKGCK